MPPTTCSRLSPTTSWATGGQVDPRGGRTNLFVDDLNALLETLYIDQAVICGLSMGGTIAQAFAAAHPEKVAGLVLSDTFPAGPLPLTGRLALTNIRFLARMDRLINYKTLNRWQLKIGNLLLPGVAGDEVPIQRLVEDAPPSLTPNLSRVTTDHSFK